LALALALAPGVVLALALVTALALALFIGQMSVCPCLIPTTDNLLDTKQNIVFFLLVDEMAVDDLTSCQNNGATETRSHVWGGFL
jgi:hypothetical protein